MNTFIRKIASLTFVALLAAAPAMSQAEKVARVVADYTVFVDPPSGFVFVKLPTGWKFVGKVDPVDLSKLPATVVTAMLVGNDDDSDDMRHMAQQQKR